MRPPDSEYFPRTALMKASAQGRVARVAALIRSGVDLDAITPEEESALTYAIVWERAEVVAMLLEAGANPNIPAPPVWTPLMYAANEGSLRVVELLLQFGALVEARDGYGRTAADIAAMRGHEAVEGLLRGTLENGT